MESVCVNKDIDMIRDELIWLSTLDRMPRDGQVCLLMDYEQEGIYYQGAYCLGENKWTTLQGDFGLVDVMLWTYFKQPVTNPDYPTPPTASE